jgi:hypothetical protein
VILRVSFNVVVVIAFTPACLAILRHVIALNNTAAVDLAKIIGCIPVWDQNLVMDLISTISIPLFGNEDFGGV